MSHLFKTWKKGQKGITGLETAIILIAFVIVASVLAYVVISAGLFSSQKAKTAVSAGLAQSGSTVELKGNVIATMAEVAEGETSYVSTITFTVGIVPGGSAVDFTPNYSPGDENLPEGYVAPTDPTNLLIISYQDNDQQMPNMYFRVDPINAHTEDFILDPGELFMITVDMEPANYIDLGVVMEGVTAGKTFTLSVIPPDGAVLPIERIMPSRTAGLVNLY